MREAEWFAAAPPAPAVEDDALTAAHARLVTAEAWWRAGNARLAIVEAAATVDLAIAAQPGNGIDPQVRRRLDDLRQLALDADAEAGAPEAEEALALAARSVALSPPAPSSESPTASDSRQE